ncbi:MAG TPA: alanine--tRNA ligase, partial [Kofleriaceae bacterium]|nr:alanine--tRNA ligase [Kofleriaceae bacterium]
IKAADVRSRFLDYFRQRGHEVVKSSPLVPHNDPTLLFTNAGMNQFKDVFTGQESRGYRRATTSQKCVRAGGKHNDLEEVGKTPRHHTFFEMLGNFSFGDYFKEDAIAWAWELLTKTYGIDAKRMVVTVYGSDPELPGVGADDEARAIWRRVTGFGDDRIIGLGKKDNFWMMGDTGPMGPCSEIHYFMDGVPSAWPTQDPKTWVGWLEIWNLVFMQFERRTKDGELFKLPAPSIDTGAGLERVTSVLQGVKSNYDTDLFTGIIAETAAIAGKTYGAHGDDDTSMRVIADHARCTTFLVGDGVTPDKTGRNYVLRRIMRRAVRHGKLLGITEPFLHRVCERVIDEMKDQYPELVGRREVIARIALEEEKLFRRTIDRGIDVLEGELAELAKSGVKTVPGSAVFKLYDTFGFPDDLTEIIAGERGYTIDKQGFEEELAKAKLLSSFGGSDQEAVGAIFKEVANQVGATKFTGYEGRGTSGEGVLKAIVIDNERVTTAPQGARVALTFDQTPFYAESGGQMGDTGTLETASGAHVHVIDTKKPAGDAFVLFGEVVRGSLSVGDKVTFVVDDERRERIRANHSATHLLNHALKAVLGPHVSQKGSLVAPDRLRFDFTHFSPMSEDEKRRVEDLVNAEIRRNADSQVDVLPIAEAQQKGAVAMFGEKYGEKVRVVRIGNESLEFCGGTHVRRAGDIGLFKLVSESGVAQGVRRIEAVTGAGALEYLRRLEDELIRTGERLKSGPFDISGKVERVLADLKEKEREIEKLKAKLASGAGGRDLMSEVKDVGGVKVLAAVTEVDDAKVLRETGDALRDKLGSGVIFLAGAGAEKVALVAMVTKDLVGRFSAGKLVGAVADALGGRGGGKPDMAQGGAPNDPAKLKTVVEQVHRLVAGS